jgi:carbon monoxide dehydrogenase subunit G
MARPPRSRLKGRIMEFDNTFEVPLPVEDAWNVLMDIRRIAPCMPGAELTEVIDPRTYKGKIGVRLGPVARRSLPRAGTPRAAAPRMRSRHSISNRRMAAHACWCIPS